MRNPHTMLGKDEVAFLQQTARDAPDGWIIVAGTWKGGDAMAIRKAVPGAKIMALDSFDGCMDSCEHDYRYPKKTIFQGDMFKNGGLERYKQRFDEHGVKHPDEIHEIWIGKDSMEHIEKRDVGLLWMDLDLYVATRACLEHFYPMVVPGGAVIAHDYGLYTTPGVKVACDGVATGWAHLCRNMYGFFKGDETPT